MEIWIFLAAAGSGYLAHCWENFQKSKEASPDETDEGGDDDDGHSGSSNGTLPSRRRYGCLSSSRRLKTSSKQNCHISKFNDGVGKVTVGLTTDLYDLNEERNEALASQHGVIRDACSCSNILTHSHVGLDAAGSSACSTKNSANSPLRCPILHTFNACCALNCSGLDVCHRNSKGHGLMPAEAFPNNWYSADFTWDSSTDDCGSMLQGQSPLQLLCNVLENDMISEEEYDRTWMPGFWNAFEGNPILEARTSSIMQEHEGRSSINNRKVRSHHKNTSSRSLSRRGSCLPSTSSEGCSSVQFDYMHSQEERDSTIHSSSSCEEPFNEPGEQLGNELSQDNMLDRFLSKKFYGLLLSPRNESFNLLSKKRTSESPPTGVKVPESTLLPCLPLQNRRAQVNASRERSASPGGDSFVVQGTVNSLLKALLFNFGVGVCMMFAIFSTKHCTKSLMEPLEGTLCSLKDLEEEVHGRTKLMVECYQTKDNRDDTVAEQINTLLKAVRRIFDVVEGVRNSLSQDLACISTMVFKHSEDRARLEAELEAELERMEMNLCTADACEPGQRIHGVSPDDLKTGNPIQGELSIRGLPCDAESIAVIDGSADSCYEVIHHGNFAVPAIDLAMRLHEVLEARQEREILELEAEVKHLDERLRAKQEELHAWKEKALHLLQGGICKSSSSFQEKDVCVEAVETTEKMLRIQKPCVGMHCATFNASLSFRCNEHNFSGCTKEALPSHLRVQRPVTGLISEADDEVPEEISKLLSDTVTGSPCSSLNGPFTSAHAKEDRNRGIAASHQELESTGFLNDAIDDALDDTFCSLKFVDKHTILQHYLEGKLEHNVGMDVSSRKKHSGLDWHEEVMSICKSGSYSQDKPGVCTQDGEGKSESSVQQRATSAWSTSDNSSYSSDLDEKLVKCIARNSQRRLLIVQAAQSAMASFYNDETSLMTGLSGVW